MSNSHPKTEHTPSPSATASYRVLVVDDDEITRLLLQRILKPHYTVLTASSAEEAVDVLNSQDIHVLLVDYVLPGMNGIELLAEVKERSPNVSRLLLTGHAGIENLRAAVNTGQIYRYLTKPVEHEELLAAVRAAAERHTLLIENQELLAQLQKTNSHLEARIAQRTAELATLNEELRASQAFLQSAVDALAAHIAILNSDGVIISVNEAWRRFAVDNTMGHATHGIGLNYLRVCEQATGMEAREALVVAAGLRAVLSGEEHLFTYEYPCHSPTEERWFSLVATPFHDGGPRHVVVAHENITERKVRERQMRQQQEVLENFLAIAAHELNTPLTTIKGRVELLLRHLSSGQLAETLLQRSLTVVEGETERLRRMIGLLFDIAYLRKGELYLEWGQVNLCALARRVRQFTAPRLTYHRLEVSCVPEDVVVDGDRERLEQVIQSLVDNSIKFSPEGGTIRIAVTREEHYAQLTVSDEGPGIAPDDLPFVFDEFYRSPSASAQRVPGAGLGLFLAHRIVEAHDGTITATSTPGAGATFVISLPLARDSEAGVSAPGLPVAGLAESSDAGVNAPATSTERATDEA